MENIPAFSLSNKKGNYLPRIARGILLNTKAKFMDLHILCGMP